MVRSTCLRVVLAALVLACTVAVGSVQAMRGAGAQDPPPATGPGAPDYTPRWDGCAAQMFAFPNICVTLSQDMVDVLSFATIHHEDGSETYGTPSDARRGQLGGFAAVARFGYLVTAGRATYRFDGDSEVDVEWRTDLKNMRLEYRTRNHPLAWRVQHGWDGFRVAPIVYFSRPGADEPDAPTAGSIDVEIPDGFWGNGPTPTPSAAGPTAPARSPVATALVPLAATPTQAAAPSSSATPTVRTTTTITPLPSSTRGSLPTMAIPSPAPRR